MGRKRALERRKEIANYWKTIWDSTEQRNYYYNMNTQEVRVRKPQALLNLMKPPLCENCEYYHATVECKKCGEYFCDECWSSIHFGGKRRKHKFRALYDFYGKRIDYGDGEYPSKWPTEIEQDEFFGCVWVGGWVVEGGMGTIEMNSHAKYGSYYESTTRVGLVLLVQAKAKKIESVRWMDGWRCWLFGSGTHSCLGIWSICAFEHLEHLEHLSI